jgi:hypothetical protein
MSKSSEYRLLDACKFPWQRPSSPIARDVSIPQNKNVMDFSVKTRNVFLSIAFLVNALKISSGGFNKIESPQTSPDKEQSIRIHHLVHSKLKFKTKMLIFCLFALRPTRVEPYPDSRGYLCKFCVSHKQKS